MSDAKNNQQQINSVVIVGGGTAGWITANHLASQLRPDKNPNITITLVESPDIPTVGVGEGTVPSMRNTLRSFGISETELIRECDATFKQSIKFVDWTYNPASRFPAAQSSYHHLFDYPFIGDENLVTYWLSHQNQLNRNFADTVSYQARLADLGLAPKSMTDKEYFGEMAYAYHLDAGKFTQLLKKNAAGNLGVKHLLADVAEVVALPDGEISALKCRQGDLLAADFFVDCSGFSSLLLGQHFNVPFIDQSNTLLVDNALVMQVPYADDKAAIACNTIATAQEAGWIWDIGLSARRGIGHVYASTHMSHEQAEQKLRDYVGPQADSLNCRRIPMRVGYREKFWVKNCVAIGLAQGFVEPLEATGLLVFDVTAKMLADSFPVNKASFPMLQKRFNQTVSYAWERVIDFVKLHYYLSQRDDSDFWIDNRATSSVSNTLLEKLALWQSQPPTAYDFFTKHEIFNLDNYLYVLYGMAYPTQIDESGVLFNQDPGARDLIANIDRNFDYLKRRLLPHRQLIEQIKQHGLSRI